MTMADLMAPVFAVLNPDEFVATMAVAAAILTLPFWIVMLLLLVRYLLRKK